MFYLGTYIPKYADARFRYGWLDKWGKKNPVHQDQILP